MFLYLSFNNRNLYTPRFLIYLSNSSFTWLSFVNILLLKLFFYESLFLFLSFGDCFLRHCLSAHFSWTSRQPFFSIYFFLQSTIFSQTLFICPFFFPFISKPLFCFLALTVQSSNYQHHNVSNLGGLQLFKYFSTNYIIGFGLLIVLNNFYNIKSIAFCSYYLMKFTKIITYII